MTHALARSAVLLAALGPCACASAPDSAEHTGPAGEQPELALAEAPDLDPSPGVVAVNLRAGGLTTELLPGHPSSLAAYGGAVPGPLIRAKRGDQLKVHFENALTVPTTVHFHGIRLPNAMDGVPDMTQPDVPPGGSFDYVFDLPDAGLFWYHPHVDTLAELGSGLYGALLVEDPDEPPDLGDPHVLVLSDVSLAPDGSVEPPKTDPASVVLGSDGNVVLVNGQVHPRLAVQVGRRQRFRVVNTARARYFELGLAGATFLKIGSDGGLIEAPVAVTNPVLAPGERLDLLVDVPGEPGAESELVALPIARGLTLPPSTEAPLLTLAVVAGSAPQSPPLPAIARTLPPLDTTGAREVTVSLTVNEQAGSVTMGINGVPGDQADPIHALVSSTDVLLVKNETPYSHPFHLHGFFFEPLDAQNQPLHPAELKDTIEVPPVTIVRLGVHYDDRPGMWMFHCHILDHAEAGMMGMMHIME